MEMSVMVMEAALKRLGEIALEERRIVEMNIYGGSALAIAYDLRESTKDVDAVFEKDRDFVRKAALQISEEMNLETDWLNDAVKGFVSHNENGNMILFGSFPSEERTGLRVLVPSPEYFFAMKCLAMRAPSASEDLNDIKKLANVCGVKGYKHAMEIVESFYSQRLISDRTRYSIEEILGTLKPDVTMKVGRAGFQNALSAFNRMKEIGAKKEKPSSNSLKGPQ